MIIEEWPENMTTADKVNYLLMYYKVDKPVKIDDDDVGIILTALNQDDVNRVWVDDEDGLNIEYNGE